MEVHEWLIDIPRDWSKQKCERCHYSGPVKHMVKFGFNDVPRRLMGYYHPKCAKIVIEENRRFCAVCGNPFFSYLAHEEDELCEKCNQGTYKAEYRRVSRSRNRASTRGLPATLTTKEWLETLDYFNWSCAYCGHGFTVLEHFIPIEIGGGTTRSNCVPACQSCNIIKEGKNPFQVNIKNAAQVAVYLKSRE